MESSATLTYGTGAIGMVLDGPKADTHQELQNWLLDRSHCRLVEREEYLKLLLCSRRLVRADEPALNLVGLLDIENGARFLIDENSVFA